MANDPRAGIRVNVGLSGSGKSYALEQDVLAVARTGMPTIWIDGACERVTVPSDLAPVTVGARSVMEACARLKADAAKRLAVVHPTDPVGDFTNACRWAVSVPGPKCVAMTEAHLGMPKAINACDGAVVRCLTQWRHFDLALVLDSQRPALLNTTAVAQAMLVRVFAIGHKLDLDWAYDEGGKELVEKIRECAAKHREARAWELEHASEDRSRRGWHVRMDETRLPPYEIAKL